MFDTLAEITPLQDGIGRDNWTIVLDGIEGEARSQAVSEGNYQTNSIMAGTDPSRSTRPTPAEGIACS
ncbi:hypothetical protein BS297_28780 [Rhodococcus erythropolis]|uniref:Uncharacterized protein n=1 Tax=Rhodococcus erythropolis TaxID=1833 RepID=A0A5N5DWL2_RHOER|nr:hypothetical protein BS297_28780 [Rhodococcus erythropolis]